MLKDLVRRYPDVFTHRGIEERSGYYAGDGSSETVDIAVSIAHRYVEEEGWF